MECHATALNSALSVKTCQVHFLLLCLFGNDQYRKFFRGGGPLDKIFSYSPPWGVRGLKPATHKKNKGEIDNFDQKIFKSGKILLFKNSIFLLKKTIFLLKSWVFDEIWVEFLPKIHKNIFNQRKMWSGLEALEANEILEVYNKIYMDILNFRLFYELLNP